MNEFALYLSQFGFRMAVPQVFCDLFAIDKKSELETYCKELTVTGREFSELVMNCHSIGYTHTPKWREFVPDHLELTETDINAFRSTGTPEEKARLGKVTSKVRATFRERRYIAAHFFVAPTGRWHLIYFDFKDTDTENENHWFGGPHFHFVNHLWPQHDPNTLWEAFDKRRQSIAGDLHVRFIDMTKAELEELRNANKPDARDGL